MNRFVVVIIIFCVMLSFNHTYTYPDDITLTTIMPGQDTARYKRGAIGPNYEDENNANIGNENLIVEGSVGIGTKSTDRAKLNISNQDGSSPTSVPGISITNTNSPNNTEFVTQVDNNGVYGVYNFTNVNIGSNGTKLYSLTQQGLFGIGSEDSDRSMLGISATGNNGVVGLSLKNTSSNPNKEFVLDVNNSDIFSITDFTGQAPGSQGNTRLSIDSTGNIGIGTDNPKAILEVNSTNSGLLPPRMTQAELNAIQNTAPAGSVAYNTTTNEINYHNGAQWVSMIPGKRIIAGTINNSGGIASGTGFSSKNIGGGYRITFDQPFANNSILTVSIVESNATRSYMTSPNPKKYWNVYFWRYDSWGGVSYEPTKFNFIATE